MADFGSLYRTTDRLPDLGIRIGSRIYYVGARMGARSHPVRYFTAIDLIPDFGYPGSDAGCNPWQPGPMLPNAAKCSPNHPNLAQCRIQATAAQRNRSKSVQLQTSGALLSRIRSHRGHIPTCSRPDWGKTDADGAYNLIIWISPRECAQMCSNFEYIRECTQILSTFANVLKI